MNGTVTIIWPAMIRFSDGRKPISVKYIREARPNVRPGSTSGDRKKPSATRARRCRLRAMPSAAIEPSSTPKPVDHAATSSEFPTARWIWRDFDGSNRASYHCNENPVGGNLSDRPFRERRGEDDHHRRTMMNKAVVANVQITTP